MYLIWVNPATLTPALVLERLGMATSVLRHGQGSREGPRAFARRQTRLWCRCGSARILARGLCPPCYAREQHDRRFFAGHRAAVLARDAYFCRVCAQPCRAARSLVVHHRRPGVSRLSWLIALCRSCHARVHRLRAVSRAVYPEAFLALWREQHPQAPEQLALSFIDGRDV